MSIRFHKGPPLLTIFHDPSSTVSLQALKLLRQAQASSSSHPSPNRTATSETSNDSPSSTYLKEASSQPIDSHLDLEILNRKVSPPTTDQMSSILVYLKDSMEKLDIKEEDISDLNDTKPMTENHDDDGSTSHAAVDGIKTGKSSKISPTIRTKGKAKNLFSLDQIQEGPLVIYWDQGLATTSLEGTKALLRKVEAEKNGSNSGSNGCVVS